MNDEQQQRSSETEHPDSDTFSADLNTVLGKLIANASEMETELHGLKELIVMQQAAIRALGDCIEGHQRALEALQPVRTAVAASKPTPVN